MSPQLSTMKKAIYRKSTVNWHDHLAPTLGLKGLIWAPLLRVDPDPAPDPAADPAKGVAAGGGEKSTATPPKDLEEIKNPEGLLSTLNKYKELGTVKEVGNALAELGQFNQLMESIQSQGISSFADIPKALQKIKEEEANKEKQELERKQWLDNELAVRQTEWQQKIADAEEKAKTADNLRLDALRRIAIQKYFDVNCKPEFVNEFDRWFPNIAPYIEFEEGTANISQIKEQGGQAFMVTRADKKVYAAELPDLFNAAMEGKYGAMTAAPLKPVTSAQGGGVINPAVGNGSSGMIRIPANFDYGKATPEQLKAIKSGKYVRGG